MLRFLSCRGRTGRLAFFLTTLLCAVMCLPAGVYADTAPEELLNAMIAWVFFWLWVKLAATARRCRDTGASGWLAPLVFVPVAGFVFELYLFFKRSRPY